MICQIKKVFTGQVGSADVGRNFATAFSCIQYGPYAAHHMSR